MGPKDKKTKDHNRKQRIKKGHTIERIQKKKAKEVIRAKNQPGERKYVWGVARGHRALNVATINPATLNKEAIEDIIPEMERRQIRIAGIQETHIPRNLDYREKGCRISSG